MVRRIRGIFSPSFEADCAVDRNSRTPRYGQNVWRRGRRRSTEGKKWCAGLKRMSMSMDHLAPCTQGLTRLSVESCRLKPAHILPRNSGFCCPKIRFERVEDGEPALSNFAQVLQLLLREVGENEVIRRTGTYETKLNGFVQPRHYLTGLSSF